MIETNQEKLKKVKEFLAKTRLDATVTQDTLGFPATSVTPEVLLKASEKIIKVSRGDVEPDNRDNLKYSRIHGLEDQIKEHIDKDAGRYQSKARQKIKQKSNLSWLTSGFFSPQIRSCVIGNSLAELAEGNNPIQGFVTNHKVTKLGEGGIASEMAIPDQSREVNESTFGFLDPVAITENEGIGVVLHATHNVRKGEDGKLYRLMKNVKTGKEEWVDHVTLLNSVCEVPEY